MVIELPQDYKSLGGIGRVGFKMNKCKVLKCGNLNDGYQGYCEECYKWIEYSRKYNEQKKKEENENGKNMD